MPFLLAVIFYITAAFLSIPIQGDYGKTRPVAAAFLVKSVVYLITVFSGAHLTMNVVGILREVSPW